MNRYIRERFLAEACHQGITSIEELNESFDAWVHQVANQRVHAETNERPIDRFDSGGPKRMADPEKVADAFRWSMIRKVTRTATVSLEGNIYSVDPALVLRRVELRFDPEDMTVVEVFYDGEPKGSAVPFVIGHHVAKAVPQAKRAEETPTGVDYLGLVTEAHSA
ncbi:transposase, partial [mine drainage metagenome]